MALAIKEQSKKYGKGAMALLVVAYTKLKLVLFMGFKFWTFFVSLWFYSLIFGWYYAVLFLTMLAVHELGHYAIMKRLGVDASLPAFIPGLGAMIFSKTLYTFTIPQQALVGIAGPVAGTAVSLFFWLIGVLSHSPVWIAAAYTGFLLNLFNLLPVPPLDGSHIARIISDRLWAVGVILFGALCWYVPTMRNPFVILIVLLSLPAVLRAWNNRSNVAPQTLSAKLRYGFLAAYFIVAGIDAGGMLATHLRFYAS